MKLQKFSLRRFGCFDDTTLEFGDGLNVLLGDNESGKSTLVRALGTILFDVPAGTFGAGKSNDSNPSAKPYLLNLEYHADGKNYRLTKDLATETILLEEIESGERWSTPAEVQAQIALALGITEKELYFATSLIRQNDLAGVEKANDLIRDKLEKMLNNNKDDLLVSRLLQRIANRLTQIQGRESVCTGEIAEFEKRINDWTTELNTTKTKIVELADSRCRQETIVNEIQVIQKLFEDKHELFRKSKQALEAEQNLNQERETYLDLGRRTRDALEIKDQITSKKEALKAIVKIDRTDLKTAESLAIQNQLGRNRLEDASAAREREDQAANLLQPKGWYRLLVGFALLASVVCIFIWNKTHGSVYLMGAGAGMLMTFVATVLWSLSTASYKHAQSKFKEADQRWRDEEERLHKNEDALQTIIHRFKVNSLEEMQDRYEEYRDLDRDIKALVTRYESLLGDSNLKDLEDELGKMTDRISRQQEVFEKFRAYAISAEKLEQLQREVAELDKRHSQLQEENANLEKKLLFLEAGSDLMAPLQERIEEGERQLKRLRSEAEILSITSRYLEEARRRVLKSSLEILEDEASAILGNLTNDHWKRVRFDRYSFAAEISPDGSTWMSSSESLSRGTVDTLHLAMRLALVKIFSGDVKPPIIMEDPLMFMDQPRREKAMAILDLMAQDFQILFLTADRQRLPWANRSIELGQAEPSRQYSEAVVGA